MIIVLFQMLYLIGKMVYKNYRCAMLGEEEADNARDSRAPVLVNYPNNKCPSGNNDPLEAYDEDDDDAPKAPRFSPPVYIQRYHAVAEVLVDPRYHKKIKKVVDFGCSELGFVAHLKNTPGIREIICVDVDRSTLERHKDKAIPLNTDYLRNRPDPLTIRVCEGSVVDRDKLLADSDAVVAIELIEHLYPETLMDLPYNIFGFIKPLVAVITTPNADFNVLFPKMRGELRHWDHKFEWTRRQFQDWAENITTRYPEYEVRIDGIGAGPVGTEKYGCCSQMAIFARIRTPETEAIRECEGLLKIVTSQEYPYRVDNRSDEQKILDEASYHITRFVQCNAECSEEYPLESLMKNLETYFITSEALREILTNGGWTVMDRASGPTILCPAHSTFSDYDTDFDDDFENDESDNEEAGWSNFYDNFAPYDGGGGGGGGGRGVEATHDEQWDDDLVTAVVAERYGDSNPNEARAIHVQAPPRISLSPSASIEIDDFDRFEPVDSSSFPETMNYDARSSSRSIDDEASEADDATRSSPETRNERRDETQTAIPPRSLRLSGASTDIIVHGDRLTSLCSIYLESSRNDDGDSCPRDITNPSFDCAHLQRSFDDSVESKRSAARPCRLRSEESPRFSSSPRDEVVTEEHRDDPRSVKTPSENASGVTTAEKYDGDVVKVGARDPHVPPTNPARFSYPGGAETPPNSWSPEIMDSGYPNSSSMPDTSPEYDLSSIAQDRISEAESPSLDHPHRPAFLEHAHMENGDLANNNRDDEGNNVMAAAIVAVPAVPDDEEDDLQPLIRVLENDMENENDIYAVENDFPVWLLRILERGNAVGQLGNHDRDPPIVIGPPDEQRRRAADPDEGFDDTSSENEESEDHDDDDDNNNDDDDDDDNNDDDDNIDVSTESSE